MKKTFLPELTVFSKKLIIDKETTKNFQYDNYLLWYIDDSNIQLTSQYAFFDIFKFSLIVRQWGQRQWKVADM